ncbi:hypothetical protein [Streptomyces muensis]|uniref:Uncharacterized protein n=1 Tax=Streptomyces muensis TaxID=1077944 RepID=A0A9X1TTS7_STRM4|nr:hypothetical protein [Streptomyces muensis]MCF1595753.1 hypothetical protein [Streptomyces muensis]
MQLVQAVEDLGRARTKTAMSLQYARHNSAVDMGSRYRVRITSKEDG